MNKIMKKSLSLLLVLVMCISFVPSYVFAEEIPAVEEISASEIETINEFEAEEEVPETEEQQQVAEEIPGAETPENEIVSETDKDASGEEAEEEIAGEETAGETGEKSEASEEGTGEETEEETQEKEEEEQEKSEEEEEEKEELLAGQLAIDISYDPIVCGQNTEFTVNVTGATGELKYYLNYIARYDYGERTDIIDPTKMSYQYDNYFNFTFYASGTYEMRVYVMDLGTSPVTNIGKTITIQIDDPNYPTLEQKVKSVAAQCISAGCSTNYEKALWLHDWLCNNCTYDYSYLYCSAEGAMCRGTGTCEAYHRAYVMLLEEVGITTDRMEGNFHVWTAALLDDGWYQIDVTWDDSAYPSSAYDTSHIYFGLNDALMQAVHSEHYVHGGKECNSLANNYFIRTGQIRSFSDAYVEDIKSNILAGEKSFTVSTKDTLYEGYDRTIINTLAAYQLQQDTYDVGEDSYTITATYLSDHSGFQIEAEKIIPTYAVTYRANGGSGTVTDTKSPYEENSTVTVLENGFTAPTGKKFVEWNTAADGTGTSYSPNGTFTITADTTLYAIWETLYAAKGSCGASALWDIDSNGVLNITGTGAMDDYSAGGAPWADRASEITAIVVAEGITHIGAYAFDNCTNAASVSLPISLESVGEGAFLGLGTTSDLYVFYLGTYDDWSNIKLETGNEILLSAYVLPKTDTPEITLDKEYILMQTGESAKINVTCNPEGYSELVKWECDENAENEKGIEFLTISDGSITANYEGSFTVTATMTVDGIDYSASCRVDVIKDEPEEDVIEVNLLTAKTTVNIYKTDYARISLLPIVPENKVDYYSSLNSKLGSQPVEEGLAIDEAYF